MRRGAVLLISLALVVAACGDGESAAPTTTSAPTQAASTTAPSSTTTIVPTTTASTTTSLPTAPVVPAVEALAWGLVCRDLAQAGWDYEAAVAYWYAEGRPARMDADENGIPCETIYPGADVVAVWGDPLPTGLSPGPGSGWRPSDREPPISPGCCAMNDNGPVSPPLPPETGAFPDDGAYAVTVTRDPGRTDSLQFTIRRWLPCSEQPDRCWPDLLPGDVYADPDDATVRAVPLDANLTVVVRTIPTYVGDTWTEASIIGDGLAFASLLRRIDAATATFAAPGYAEKGIDLDGGFLATGTADPTFPYGPAPIFEDGGSLLGYRGPEGTYLTPGFWAIFEWDDGGGMYGWWCTLEIVDAAPILHVWAGQIAG